MYKTLVMIGRKRDIGNLAKILDVASRVLFPANCYGCGRAKTYLCGTCAKYKLRHIYQPTCCVCGLECYAGGIHGECRQYSYLYDCYSVCRSSPTVDNMLHDGKYKFCYQVYNDLARLMAVKSLEWGLGDQIVTWVPQSTYRTNWRGFNQAKLLAQKFALVTGRGCVEIFARMHNTRNQVGLTRKDRLLNLRGQIAVKAEIAPRIEGKDLIIIDDVFTTGATLQECAKALELAGGGRACGITILRA